VAHNAQAAEALGAALGGFHCPGRIHAVLGLMRDKDAVGVARPVAARVASWHLGQAPVARALPAAELKDLLAAAGMGPALAHHGTLEAALGAAEAAARPGDCVLVFGSFTTVEAALRRVQRG
jgi:dihydrofolate synthase / folylpolyglutamate synthase